jgi:dTDP-4-dehydrorhamnose reductase
MKKFDTVVNFAAFTNVDAAEAQREDKNGLVWKLNVEGAENLSEVCSKNNTFLVHISTDFVFPGTEDYPGPYDENSKLPENSDGIDWYGWTKLQAELKIRNYELRNAVVRYGYPFRAAKYDQKRDWARNLINLFNEQKLYPLFDDQVQSVLFVDDLVDPLSKIINGELTGIFHIASSDTTTPFEIGSYLLGKYVGKPVEIQKGSMVEFLRAPGRTPRSRLGGLKVEKTEERLSMKFRTSKEMVDEFVGKLKS